MTELRVVCSRLTHSQVVGGGVCDDEEGGGGGVRGWGGRGVPALGCGALVL
jgi:hypothetical protein